METHSAFGPLLKEWRQQRRFSQLGLAAEAGISQRHLSFMESGRAAPSRDMVLRLAEQLAVPLRERNRMLLAAGLSPQYRENDVAAPDFEMALDAARHVLAGHEPYPAVAVDRHWNLVAANKAASFFFERIGDASLLAAPANVLRASLHPEGLAPSILNLAAWRAHLLHRLDQQMAAVPDPQLAALRRELAAYPIRSAKPRTGGERPAASAPGLAVSLEVATDAGVMSFITTVTVFGSPLDVTLSELALETFFPADRTTRDHLQARGR